MTRYAKDLPRLRRNLARVYARRTEEDTLNGMLWYENARVLCQDFSQAYGHSVGVCAAVTAAISPQCSWERNVLIAADVLADRPISIGGALNANITKAKRLRDMGETDTRAVFKDGPKVFNFARNLAGDCHAVTVDTHAVQAAYDDVRVNVNMKSTQYQPFADACRDVATAHERTSPPCDTFCNRHITTNSATSPIVPTSLAPHGCSIAVGCRV